MRKEIASLILGSALMVGCQTARQNEDKVMILDKETISNLDRLANLSYVGFEAGSNTGLSYADAKSIENRYQNLLPSEKVDLYIIKDGKNERYSMDTTGPIYRSVDKISKLEENLAPFADSKKMRIYIGSPDKDFATYRSAENQLSNSSGLLAVDTYSNGAGNVFLNVKQETNTNSKFRQQDDYVVSISFGKEAFEQIKTRKDSNFFVKTGLESGVGLLVAGPGGAAGAAVGNAVEGVWAYWEGNQSPAGTFIAGDRLYAGNLETKVADTVSSMRTANKTQAHEMIVLDYNGGKAVVYTTGARDIKTNGNTLTFKTTAVGANQIRVGLLGALKVGASYGTTKLIFDDGHVCPEDGVTGGTTGGPGGGIPGGVSGGTTGGAGGR